MWPFRFRLSALHFQVSAPFIGYLMTGYYPDLWLMIAIIIGGFAGGMLGSRAQKLFSEKTLEGGACHLPCSSCSSGSSRSRSGSNRRVRGK
jgi:hypothetical protein